MLTFTAVLTAYVVGGFTFLPVLIAAVLALLFYTSPVVYTPPSIIKTGDSSSSTPTSSSAVASASGSATNAGPNPINFDKTSASGKKDHPHLHPLHELDDDVEPIVLYRAGWLTVRRTYEPTVLTKEEGTYMGMMVSGYRSFMENRSREARRSKLKERFYGVLKRNILFLYEGEEQQECWAAIEISQYQVVIFPEGGLEGELFVKRNAIGLKPLSLLSSRGGEVGVGGGGGERRSRSKSVTKTKPLVGVGQGQHPHSDSSEREREPDDDDPNPLSKEATPQKYTLPLPAALGSGLSKPPSQAPPPTLSSSTSDNVEVSAFDPSEPLPWFIFAKVNSDKEDWYHSLILASKLGSTTGKNQTIPIPTSTPTTTPITKDQALFDPDDMARLVEGIDSQPDSIPMRWFNALLGRIFLAVYRTDNLEAYIISRIVRKLKRVKTPSILSEIQVREVNVGTTVPYFSKPMLKELTSEGDASMEVHVSYMGDFRITIETVATIPLGSRFKPYSVRLVLAVCLKELEGTLLLKIKKPPSSRVWFGFSTMPRMSLSVEPVVSTRQIKWSMITSPIESRLREVILESIVVPHMDDFPFFNTAPFIHRAGIYGDALRRERDLSVPAGEPSDENHQVASEELNDDDLIGSGGATPMSSTSGVRPSSNLEDEKKVGTTKLRARRRRSSDGDQTALEFTVKDGSQNTSRHPESSSQKPSSSSSSTLTGFSLSSWRSATGRDKDQASSGIATGANVIGGGGSGHDKRKNWFNPGRSATTLVGNNNLDYDSSTSVNHTGLPNGATTPPTIQQQNQRSSSPASSKAFDDKPQNNTLVVKDNEEVSASRLRDILTKRARSREREREEKEKETDQDQRSNITLSPPQTSTTLSGLSLTAPTKDRPSSVTDDDRSRKSAKNNDNAETSNLNSHDSFQGSASSASSVVDMSISPPVDSPFTTSISQPPGSSTPGVPARPSFTKATPPPLPMRSGGPGFASTVTTSSILSSWRAKAADKEAIAVGVAQAKEKLKGWGATWNARKTPGVGGGGAGTPESLSRADKYPSLTAAGTSPDLGRIFSSHPVNENGRSGSRTPIRGATTPLPSTPTSKDDPNGEYRASKLLDGDNTSISPSSPIAFPKQAVDSSQLPFGASRRSPSSRSTLDVAYQQGMSPQGNRRSPSLSSNSSPSTAGHFTPAAPLPTTKLSTASALPAMPRSPSSSSAASPLTTSSSPPPATTAGVPIVRTYKAATMMTIPGIRDLNQRKAVASDHVSANELQVQSSSPEKPAVISRKGSEESRKSETSTANVIGTGLAPSPFASEDPISTDSKKEEADATVASSATPAEMHNEAGKAKDSEITAAAVASELSTSPTASVEMPGPVQKEEVRDTSPARPAWIKDSKRDPDHESPLSKLDNPSETHGESPPVAVEHSQEPKLNIKEPQDGQTEVSKPEVSSNGELDADSQEADESNWGLGDLDLSKENTASN